MATSGSYDFDLTRNEIITSALRKCGAVAQGESPSAEQISEGAEALNVIVKDLDSFRLWKREWQNKTLVAASEVTGTDALIYSCTRSHTSSAATTPITGANHLSYWRLRGTTGGIWADATAYVATGEFVFDADVIGVEKAFMKYSGSDLALALRGFNEYMHVTSKDDVGEPSILFIEKARIMKGYLWPQPINVNYLLNYLVYVKLEDFDAANNNADVLAKWLRWLIWELASELGPEYGINMAQQQYLDMKSRYYKMVVIKEDIETDDGSFIQSCY